MQIKNKYLLLDPWDGAYKHFDDPINGFLFAEFCGSTPGDAALVWLKLLRTKPVEPKFIRRNDYAKALVEAFNKKNDIKVESSTLHKVKAKSMHLYDELEFNVPLNDRLALDYDAHLQGKSKVALDYVFFDPVSELSVFLGQKPESLKGVKRVHHEWEIDEINKDISEPRFACDFACRLASVTSYMSDIKKFKRIPLQDLSVDALNEVKKYVV